MATFHLEQNLGIPFSTSLEYYIADWNMARFAEAMGHKDVAKTMDKRGYGAISISIVQTTNYFVQSYPMESS